MRRTWLVTLVVGLLAAFAVPAVAAPPSAQHYSMKEVQTAQLDDGMARYSGAQPVWHMRGWTARYETYDEAGEAGDLVAGEVVVVANWNVNMANWRGNLWGTANYSSESHDDSGWETTWTAQWIGPGKWAGRGVGDGYGAFEGMKIRFEIENIPGGQVMSMASGFVFTPGQR
jgi:hypothetical protein